ncbi:helix-turn-helix transcriptional regulator [Nocardia huaxiensis]|uniref:HTH-type transcriptional regulator RipA n=1 Tax=Nocardia huaxiensis TaxID=2755382 RepID=A0A7D6ZB10_9NOCA|nr:helix-turn-helix transcriptional regulator [Nocardia huaxiensis]QLY29398.1 helix-turn-helix transcriptional regulator [Nocardia huaxiensis]
MSPNGHRRTPAPPSGDAESMVISAPAGPTAMVFGAGALPAGLWFDEHAHPQHQIAWATRGVITVEIGDGRWVLPPTRALWIPGGMRHRTGTSEGAMMSGIYLEPDRTPVAFPAPTMLRVSTLLHELFGHLTAATTTAGQRQRAEAVIFDLLQPVDVIPVGARMPEDARARRVADALLADPADPRTLEQFAPYAAASPRTLARAFLAETGITFGHWRTQIRLAASLPLLADGLPVARIAARVGYATPSAYVAAFHREVGVAPGRYFAR